MIEYSVFELVAQRVYGLALGNEDPNDHGQLRHDPPHGNQEGRFFHGDYREYCYAPCALNPYFPDDFPRFGVQFEPTL